MVLRREFRPKRETVTGDGENCTVKGFIIFTVYQILIRLLNQEDKICESCSTQEKDENASKWENLKGRDHSEDPGIKGKPEGKGPLGRPRNKGEGKPNFKIDPKYDVRLLTQFIWRAHMTKST
jgi:hypothetical protein